MSFETLSTDAFHACNAQIELMDFRSTCHIKQTYIHYSHSLSTLFCL